MENIITIPPSSDKVYGYLSNDSKYGFIEKSDEDAYVYWQTVTHYIEAKKFEGTQYEDEIRLAKTVMQVKRMTREREIRDIGNQELIQISKKYGMKKIDFQIKQSWEADLEKLLCIAIRAKFYQNQSLKERLLSTSPKTIVGYANDLHSGKVNVFSAQIIMELRQSLLKNTILHSKLKSKPELSDRRISLIRDVCMKISKHIAGMERWDRILPEMVEDAIFNICQNKKLFTRIISFVCENDKEYFLNVRKLFVKIDWFQSEIDAPTNKIVTFLMWCCGSEKKLQLIYNKSLRFVDKIEDSNNMAVMKNFDSIVNIPHSKRWYREKSNIRMNPEHKKNIVTKDIA